ncbi:sulfotransferase family protein [Lamprobacter modestohalophilus]|uniref:Sulfotransferase family protein n=2 Tax=Lamprobacter modestohalophilus TaxID=1064514 RepID=A0A9X0W948_9GAMM|nr:sulfotransferase family protein [Lamprobacter modestohalophilus]
MEQLPKVHRREVSESAAQFRAAIDSALELVQDYTGNPVSEHRDLSQPLPSLLQQCQNLLAEAQVEAPLPVRTLHHLACSGGTLISRCIAAQPNTQVLSEVDPLSPFVPSGFLPTDLIGLSRFSSRPANADTQIEMFLAGLRVLYGTATQHGQHLILRDHSHGHFSFGAAVTDRPTLHEIVSRAFPVKSIVSVRHPLDAYLSLLDSGWVQHFSPATLDEYARRSHAFLDAYQNVELIRYEDFVEDPPTVMQTICATLSLDYNPDFTETFAAITLSGDSGRRGDFISPRPRRPHPPAIDQEAEDSEAFQTLLSRLDYHRKATAKSE